VGRRFQYPDPERPDRLVKFAGKDTVAIMNQKSVWITVGDDFTQLLQCPGGAWMSRDVVVDQSPAAMLDPITVLFAFLISGAWLLMIGIYEDRAG
jgi:hypothetical protein